MSHERYLAFPFHLDGSGRVATTDLDGGLRGRIEQVLFTSPGERVMLPEFGCGLRDLVFQPNSDVLAAATEFTVAKALQSTLGDLLMINGVQVTSQDETLSIEIVYTRTSDLQRERVIFEVPTADGAGRG